LSLNLNDLLPQHDRLSKPSHVCMVLTDGGSGGTIGGLGMSGNVMFHDSLGSEEEEQVSPITKLHTSLAYSVVLDNTSTTSSCGKESRMLIV
jgi:hypothetical protein